MKFIHLFIIFINQKQLKPEQNIVFKKIYTSTVDAIKCGNGFLGMVSGYPGKN